MMFTKLPQELRRIFWGKNTLLNKLITAGVKNDGSPGGGMCVWTGLSWPRIETGVGRL